MQTNPVNCYSSDDYTNPTKLWLIGWALCYINHYRLFNVKSTLQIYIK